MADGFGGLGGFGVGIGADCHGDCDEGEDCGHGEVGYSEPAGTVGRRRHCCFSEGCCGDLRERTEKKRGT